MINGKAAFGAVPAANTATAMADSINMNTGNTGVKATAYNELSGASPNAKTFAAGVLTINGSSVGEAGSVEELVTAINRDASGVVASLNDNGTISLSNDTGANIVIAGTSPTDAGFTAGTYRTASSRSTASTAARSTSRPRTRPMAIRRARYARRRQGAGPQRDRHQRRLPRLVCGHRPAAAADRD